MDDTLDEACRPRISSGGIRVEHGHQARSDDAEGAGAAPPAGGGAAASGCTAGRSGPMGQVVATVGDALEPTARAGRFAGSAQGGAGWATASSERPAAQAPGEAPQGRGGRGRVCHGDVEAAADCGVDTARVRRAPGDEFGVANAAADGLERTAHEPSLAAESGRADALEADPVTIPKRSEEHTSELQSLRHLVCRLLLEKKKE